MIKLQDFATQQGVTDRQVQRLLKKYASELEGMYERKGPNGTWLSDEACEILRSKMKQAPVTLITPSEHEEELTAKIRDLERELYETQSKYTAYVENVTPLLQKASEQLALAERAGEYKEQNEALKAQNANLSDEKDKIELKAKEDAEASQNRINELSEALQAEKSRKLTWKERLFGVKG